MKYYINGFKESSGYFFGIGHFTTEELELLDSGEVVEKYGNQFWIVKGENS